MGKIAFVLGDLLLAVMFGVGFFYAIKYVLRGDIKNDDTGEK